MSKTRKPNRALRVFLCHSFDDKDKVRDLYRKLLSDGFDPWLDEEKLLPGQHWKQEIPKAVRNSDAVIVCLSQGSITKSGYVQKEIKHALDVADERPEDIIFLIPVKLEICDIPDRLGHLQYVSLYDENGYERLIAALQAREKSLGLSRNNPLRAKSLGLNRRNSRNGPSIQVSIILDSGCLLTMEPDSEFQDVGYYQCSKLTSDIRVSADGEMFVFDELRALGKSCIIEVRHVDANGKVKGGSPTQSAAGHQHLLHMNQLYGEWVRAERSKFDCILRFQSGHFSPSSIKPIYFYMHRSQADGRFSRIMAEPGKLLHEIAHNLGIHYKLQRGEALELARGGETFWSSLSTGAKERLVIEIVADATTTEKYYRYALKRKRDGYWLPAPGLYPPWCEGNPNI
jgi:TIR domain